MTERPSVGDYVRLHSGKHVYRVLAHEGHRMERLHCETAEGEGVCTIRVDYRDLNQIARKAEASNEL